MGKVIIDISVEHELLDLVELLYNKGYFGFKTDAQAYVDEIINSYLEYPINANIKPRIAFMANFIVDLTQINALFIS